MIIKKGDVVGRKSYGNDILFVVEKVIRTGNDKSYAILKGLTIRIVADSPLEDLDIINKDIIDEQIASLEKRLQDRVRKGSAGMNRLTRRATVYTGKILHLDGDRKYSDKSAKYYKELGLNAVVKNIPEAKQSAMVRDLLERYKPDILVITGHDAMIKNGRNYNDLYNYKNSKHFINTVKEARKWKQAGRDLVIFAGACQSFFEAIMQSGANFASSPARVLIDFIDPLIVAEKVATTDNRKYLTIEDIADELRDGINGIGGTGARGKKEIIYS
jgi:spore coat assembly protein